jgi:ABC-2 type transport system ATP-binding protein
MTILDSPGTAARHVTSHATEPPRPGIARLALGPTAHRDAGVRTRRDPGAQRPAAAGIALSCRALRERQDGHVVVDDVWFDVAAGTAYGLTGPAGCGKSAVVRLVCGLRRPDGGTILVGGRSLPDDELVGRVSYVPQSGAVVATMTVSETVLFWARALGLPRQRVRERAAEVLALVGLDKHSGQRTGRCTGGVLRELSLAVALLPRPDLVVLDEPAVGIDAAARARLHATLGRLRDRGTALLYATRNGGEVADLCDVVGVMDAGRLVDEYRRHELPLAA